MSAIGVDVGGTKLLAVRIEDDGSVVDERRTPTPVDGRRIVTDIAGAVHELTSDTAVTACGVGIAGLVDHEAGTFVWGPHVAGVDIGVREQLESELGMAVTVDNDANSAALAEHRLGSGRGSEALLLLTLGTGIGGAMMFGGSVYRGRRFAGEFGHTRLVDGTALCSCGRFGCWETEAAGPALERMARDSMATDPDGSLANSFENRAVTGPAITAAAQAGDPQAIRLVERIGHAFGRGLRSLISILDPDRVVIGGGLGSVGEVLLGPIREGAGRDRYAADHTELPPIVAAELGERAGAVGAGLMALENAGDQ